MRKQTIRINGVSYPARMTMGAMMEFKRQTGREVTELQGSDISLALTLLYCCIISASRADGVPVPFASPVEMADYMDADDFASWQNDQFSAGSPAAAGEGAAPPAASEAGMTPAAGVSPTEKKKE